jgi:hypothetical protein
LQRHRGGGVAVLGGADEEHEHLTRGGLRLRRGDVGQRRDVPADSPVVCMGGPAVQFDRLVTGGDVIGAAHQPGVTEIAGKVGQRWVLRRIGEHGGDVVAACQVHIRFVQKTGVAHFQHVTQRLAVEFAGQVVEEGAEIVRVEWPPRRHLPQDRSQAIAHLGQAAMDETAGALAGVGQSLALDDVARCLQREDETFRGFRRPFRVGGRFLRAVEGAVDLDRPQLAAGVFQLASLHEFGWIEVVAPRRVGPAADADADRPGSLALVHGRSPVVWWRSSSVAAMHVTSHAPPVA